MSTSRRIRKIWVVLAIILMFTAYGLPSSLHFKICIGEDGHFDITPLACASNQQTPVSKHSNTNPTDHHGKCTDFTTACDKKEICSLSSVLLSRNPSSKISQLTPLAKASGVLPLPDIKPSIFPSCSTKISFSLPVCLRSVVLLI